MIDIVIPFRNRTEQFWKYYANFRKHTRNKPWDARIIVVEQTDSLPFRRGWLINVGVRLAIGLDGGDGVPGTRKPFLSAGVGGDAGGSTSGSALSAGEDSSERRAPPDCVVTSDVDMLPETTVDFADCQDAPTQFCAEVQQFDWGMPYHTYSGGVVGATPAGWRRFNGFSNRGKGWGGEDDVLYARVETKGLVAGKLGDTIFGKVRLPEVV